MSTVLEESTLWVPKSGAEKEAVRRQMNRMLETSHFKNSRRYPALFRFIIEEALEGRGEYLKERLIGVQVFERPADYDTAADPIVRVTIAEVRKRIAQYYHDDSHESELRIELLPGRYEPEFRHSRDYMQQQHHHAAAEPAPYIPEPIATAAEPSATAPASTTHTISRGRRLAMQAGFALCLAVLAIGGWFASRPSAVEQLWAPVFATHQTVTFVLPEGAQKVEGVNPNDADGAGAGIAPSQEVAVAKPTTFLQHEILGENVVFSDMLAVMGISTLFASHHVESRYRLNISTSLDDLRQGPVVLIGGLDNQWTLHALAPLRYRFSGSDENGWWIIDTKDASKRSWVLNTKADYRAVRRDYAIVARVHDDTTGQVEMIVAGIGMSGTAAAGELLVDPHAAAELRNRIGKDFDKRDFEAVLSTDVVNGIAGSPKILEVDIR